MVEIEVKLRENYQKSEFGTVCLPKTSITFSTLKKMKPETTDTALWIWFIKERQSNTESTKSYYKERLWLAVAKEWKMKRKSSETDAHLQTSG